MCIAIPGKIVSIINENTAVADIGGINRNIKLDLVGKADQSFVGIYVLVHAGYAISIISEKEAESTLKIFEEILGLD